MELQGIFNERYETNQLRMYRLQVTVADVEEITGKIFYQAEYEHLNWQDIEAIEWRYKLFTKEMAEKLKTLKPVFQSPRRFFFDVDEINAICGEPKLKWKL